MEGVSEFIKNPNTYDVTIQNVFNEVSSFNLIYTYLYISIFISNKLLIIK